MLQFACILANKPGTSSVAKPMGSDLLTPRMTAGPTDDLQMKPALPLILESKDIQRSQKYLLHHKSLQKFQPLQTFL